MHLTIPNAVGMSEFALASQLAYGDLVKELRDYILYIPNFYTHKLVYIKLTYFSNIH